MGVACVLDVKISRPFLFPLPNKLLHALAHSPSVGVSGDVADLASLNSPLNGSEPPSPPSLPS